MEAVRRKIHDIVEILADKNAADSLKGVYSKKGDVSGMICSDQAPEESHR